MKIPNCRLTYVSVINNITAIVLCRRLGSNDVSEIETIPSPWTAVTKVKSVCVQTEDITSVKSDRGVNEISVTVHRGTESNDDNKCDGFHSDSLSDGNISENISNIDENYAVSQGDSESSIYGSMDDSNKDNITVKDLKLCDSAEDVSNCLMFNF